MNKHIRSAIVKLMGAALAVSLAALPISASNAPRVMLGDREYTGDVRLIDSTTYVGLREFSELHGAEVTWDSGKNLAGAFTGSLSLLAVSKAPYITANGRYLWLTGGSFVENGRMYVPLRAIGSAFGYETSWNGDSFSASLTRKGEAIESAAEYYSGEDLYWLSRIISAEAEGESLYGKLAVGSVVMNRVRSREFPNSVREVVFDRKNGVQFTPVANGRIYRAPDEESVIAAKLCLEGKLVNRSVLFFLNTRIAESFWITNNRDYVMTVGNHDFYA